MSTASAKKDLSMQSTARQTRSVLECGALRAFDRDAPLLSHPLVPLGILPSPCSQCPPWLKIILPKKLPIETTPSVPTNYEVAKSWPEVARSGQSLARTLPEPRQQRPKAGPPLAIPPLQFGLWISFVICAFVICHCTRNLPQTLVH